MVRKVSLTGVKKNKLFAGLGIALIVAIVIGVIVLFTLTATGVIGDGMGISGLIGMNNHPASICQCFNKHVPTLSTMLMASPSGETEVAASDGKPITNGQILNLVKCVKPHIKSIDEGLENASDKAKYVQTLMKQTIGTKCAYKTLKTMAPTTLYTDLDASLDQVSAFLEAGTAMGQAESDADPDWSKQPVPAEVYMQAAAMQRDMTGVQPMASNMKQDAPIVVAEDIPM